MRIAILALLLAAAPAMAHEHGQPWYNGLRNELDQACCDNTHCREIGADDWRREGEGFKVRYGGTWWPLASYANVGFVAPDGHVHACKYPHESFVRCIVWPGAF